MTETQDQEALFKQKLEAIALTAKEGAERDEFNKEIEGIVKLYTRFLMNRKRVIDWSKIKPPPRYGAGS